MKLFLFVAIFPIFLISAVSGAELKVPSEYPTIQSAIDAASSGDIIIVAAGTYTGPGNRDIDFNGKSIRITSQSGPETTVIDCELSGRGFYLHTNETMDSTIEGFIITRGNSPEGAGIFCDHASPIIYNCIIKNSVSTVGGGISIRYGSPQIVSCALIGNKVETAGDSIYGGGFFCMESSPLLVDCSIEDNTAISDDSSYGYGAGIACYQNSFLSLFNCRITGNSAYGLTGSVTGVCGAILSSNSNLTIQNCTITENAADETSGILSTSSTVNMTDSILWNNEPGEYDGSLTASHCVVQGGMAGEGNLDADPLFVTGPRGNFYLSQIKAGQSQNSPCLDAGSDGSADICIEFFMGTHCMDLYITRTDEIRDFGFVDIGYHYPSLHRCTSFSSEIDMPSIDFGPGDECFVDVYVCNPSDNPFTEACIFVILEVAGQFFFAPSFSFDSIDHLEYDGSLDQGLDVIGIIPPFSWPSGAGSGSAAWYCGITNLEMTTLIGEFDFLGFNWHS